MGLARAVGDAELMARVALARGIQFSFGVTDAALVAMLNEALAAMPAGDSPSRARVLARLAAALQPAPHPNEPIQMALDAIAMARRIEHRRTLIDVIHVGLAAMFEYSPPEQLDALVQELLTLVGPGDLLITLRARMRAAFVALELNNRPRFEQSVAAHAELAARVGLPRHRWPVLLFQSLLAARASDRSR